METRELKYDIFDILPGFPDVSNYFKKSGNPGFQNGFTDAISPEYIRDGHVYGVLESANFIEGSDGWRIMPNGDVEFNDGTFRGSLVGNSINIPDAINPLFSVSSDGLVTAIGITSLNIKSFTTFETAGRFTNTSGGGGSYTYNTNGLTLATSATGTSFAKATWFVTPKVFQGSPVITAVVNMNTLNAASGGGAAFFGLGEVTMDGGGTSFGSLSFAGFWLQKDTSVVNLYAVQNNGNASHAQSSILTTLANNDVLELMAKINGTGSVDYYWRKNVTGAFTKLTLSTKVPVATIQFYQFSITNVTSAFEFSMSVTSASYER